MNRVEYIVDRAEGHGGLHRVAQWLTDNPYFTGATWCLTATLTEERWD